MLKKIFALLVIVVVGVAVASQVGYAETKVAVCHMTSSNTTPVVLIHVSPNAVPAHLDHGDFLLPSGESDCSGGTPPIGPE